MTAKFSRLGALGVCVTAFAAAACGDDGLGKRHDVLLADAAIDAMVPCQAAASYTPTFAADEQTAENYPATGTGEDATLHNIYFYAPLDGDEPGDWLYLELYEQYGAFSGGDIKTGVFPIVEDDLTYSSCGACITVGGDVADEPAGYYMAGGGTLTLTSVTGRFTGSINNVTLYRVKKDPETGGPSDVQIDCMTHITSASFDTPLVAGTPP